MTQPSFDMVDMKNAIEENNLLKVTGLINEGFPVDRVLADSPPKTPLQLAAQRGHLKIVKALVAAGANIHASDENAASPLHLAISQDHVSVCEYLIKVGANVNLPSRIDGYTPLHVAANGGNEAILKLLLEGGALVNAVDFQGLTPLHLAAMGWGVSTSVPWLIKAGANPNALDSFGKTPLHRAEDADALEKLVECGADLEFRPKCPPKDYVTPLEDGLKSGVDGIVKACQMILSERTGKTVEQVLADDGLDEQGWPAAAPRRSAGIAPI